VTTSPRGSKSGAVLATTEAAVAKTRPATASPTAPKHRAVQAVSKWRDPDSNWGHHDFQGPRIVVAVAESPCKSAGPRSSRATASLRMRAVPGGFRTSQGSRGPKRGALRMVSAGARDRRTARPPQRSRAAQRLKDSRTPDDRAPGFGASTRSLIWRALCQVGVADFSLLALCCGGCGWLGGWRSGGCARRAVRLIFAGWVPQVSQAGFGGGSETRILSWREETLRGCHDEGSIPTS
jgi:hypothetical protein